MKIKNFNTEKLTTTKETYYFDNVSIEYFPGSIFNVWGYIDVKFENNEIDLCYAYLTIIKENGSKISLSEEIQREIKRELESIFENKKIEL